MSIISLVRSLFFPKISAEKSELSHPDIHKPPYGFYASHFRVLETINLNKEEITGYDINWLMNEGSADKRASELWLMGLVNVRVEKYKLKNGVFGKKYYYTINKKGREALINFNHKF